MQVNFLQNSSIYFILLNCSINKGSYKFGYFIERCHSVPGEQHNKENSGHVGTPKNLIKIVLLKTK